MADSFTWGSGGEKVSGRRKVAEALLMQGSDSSPVRSSWQGVNRIAQALIGGYQLGEIEREEKTKDAATTSLLLSHPALASATGAAPVAPQPSIAPASPTANTPLRIYGENEASPLDVPVGAARDMAVRTVVAEAGNQPFEGQTGVAAVLRNRAVDGGYGGDTLPGVIQKPYAFEPWNTPAGRAKMAGIDPSSPQYQNASRAVDAAYFGEDPTEGATHFYSPRAQAALGRPAPAWAQGDNTRIGDHVFFSPDDGARLPAAAMPAQGQLPTVQQAQPSGAQMSSETANYVRALISNPRTQAAGIQMLMQHAKPRETFTQETDAAGNIWSVNQQNGQRTIALKKDREPDQTANVRDYEYYKNGVPPGQAAMSFDAWTNAKARAAATTINNNPNFGGGSERQVFDEMVVRSQQARALAQGLGGIRNAREAIETGAITGFRADDRISLQKAAQYFGVPIGDAQKIENSEVFKAAIAPQIAAVLKSTVGTANISDSDRRFAERAAGGSLELNEGSIRRLLDIMERASLAQLQDYQSTLDTVYPDAKAHARERSLFGFRIPEGGKKAAGATKSGVSWEQE